jgi:GrpB-like predicted nucleotidyltransferase (UPF0157 family)
MLQGALGHRAKVIHHVGSTSVPGLAAKPIIDVDIVVEHQDKPIVIQSLAKLGYRHLGNLGIPQRDAFKAPPGPIPHHLYVCPPDSQALANHLAVRNYLRQHPERAAAYGKLKGDLARRYADDMDSYVQGKSEFLSTILRECGFNEDQLLAIKKMNQKKD